MKKSVHFYFVFTSAVLAFILLLMLCCKEQDPGLKDAFEDDFMIGVALNPHQIPKQSELHNLQL